MGPSGEYNAGQSDGINSASSLEGTQLSVQLHQSFGKHDRLLDGAKSYLMRYYQSASHMEKIQAFIRKTANSSQRCG